MKSISLGDFWIPLHVSFPCVYICLLFVRYLQADPDSFDLRDLKCKFDVILIEPPLEEYYRESGIIANERFWTWDDVSYCKFLSNSTT